jgi:hypothetical protein
MKGVGYRLDHLIRNALDRSYDYPYKPIMSAIKHFLEQVEPRFRRSGVVWYPKYGPCHFAPETLAFINPRLEFCRSLIEQFNRDLTAYGYPHITSDEFRQLAIQYGVQVVKPEEQIVFFNPFCHFAAYADEFSASRQMLDFLNKIQYTYWN